MKPYHRLIPGILEKIPVLIYAVYYTLQLFKSAANNDIREMLISSAIGLETMHGRMNLIGTEVKLMGK